MLNWIVRNRPVWSFTYMYWKMCLQIIYLIYTYIYIYVVQFDGDSNSVKSS